MTTFTPAPAFQNKLPKLMETTQQLIERLSHYVMLLEHERDIAIRFDAKALTTINTHKEQMLVQLTAASQSHREALRHVLGSYTSQDLFVSSVLRSISTQYPQHQDHLCHMAEHLDELGAKINRHQQENSALVRQSLRWIRTCLEEIEGRPLAYTNKGFRKSAVRSTMQRRA